MAHKALLFCILGFLGREGTGTTCVLQKKHTTEDRVSTLPFIQKMMLISKKGAQPQIEQEEKKRGLRQNKGDSRQNLSPQNHVGQTGHFYRRF